MTQKHTVRVAYCVRLCLPTLRTKFYTSWWS